MVLLSITYLTRGQTNETIYALNYGVTTKEVKQGITIKWGPTKPFPSASYIKIKKKENDTYYIQTTVNGQFAYGHYFKYQEKSGDEFKYVRIDGGEVEYLFVNYPLSKLATSNQYDEKVILKLINYRTSFAILMKF
jgi:hypothetical protein